MEETMKRFTGLMVAILMSCAGLAMADDAEVVEFRIPAGTGKNAWNTRETMVEVKVGQILRIINDDTTKHRLHTNGGRPCAHGPGNVAKGDHYDCVVKKAADPDVEDDFCYDHNVGPGARFYVRATN